MKINILNVVIHKHDLKEDKLILSENVINFCDTEEEGYLKTKHYLTELLQFNARKNIGRLAKFLEGENEFRKYVHAILKDNNKTLGNSKRIMQLIKTLTPHTSTPGNYMFVLYSYENIEIDINEEGETVQFDVNETRLALLKFEFQDSSFVKYEEIDGKVISKIEMTENDSLPHTKEKLKKAIFINNSEKNILLYELKIIDRESPNVAYFFSKDIIKCSPIVKSQNFIVVLTNECRDFVDIVRGDKRITEEQAVICYQRIDDLIKKDTIVSRETVGQEIFKGFFDEQDEIDNLSDELDDKLYKRGLVHDQVKITQDDEDKYKSNYIIYINGSKSYIKYTEDDVKKKRVILKDDHIIVRTGQNPILTSKKR